jgi:hypothetical protein
MPYWARNEVEAVDAAVDEDVAEEAEGDDGVDADVEEVVGDEIRDAAKGGADEAAGGDEEDGAVERGLAPPEDAKGEPDGEDGHVAEGDELEGVGTGFFEDGNVKVAEDDGRDAAERDHGDADARDEPAERAVDADVVRADEGGLQEEEQQPGREGGCVEPQDTRTGDGRAEEDIVDGVAEAPEDDGDHEEGHREVEVLVDEAVAPGEVEGRTGDGCLGCGGHGLVPGPVGGGRKGWVMMLTE